MAQKKTTEFDYAAKAAALDDIMRALQAPDIEIDAAKKLYDQGIKLVSELENYLTTTENELRQKVAGE